MTKFEAIKAFCEKFQVPATIIKTGVKAEGNGLILREWNGSGYPTDTPEPQVFTLAWDTENAKFAVFCEAKAGAVFYDYRNKNGSIVKSYVGGQPKYIWQILKGYSDRWLPLFFIVVNDWGKPEATYTLNEYPDLKEYLECELEKVANQND